MLLTGQTHLSSLARFGRRWVLCCAVHRRWHLCCYRNLAATARRGSTSTSPVVSVRLLWKGFRARILIARVGAILEVAGGGGPELVDMTLCALFCQSEQVCTLQPADSALRHAVQLLELLSALLARPKLACDVA